MTNTFLQRQSSLDLPQWVPVYMYICVRRRRCCSGCAGASTSTTISTRDADGGRSHKQQDSPSLPYVYSLSLLNSVIQLSEFSMTLHPSNLFCNLLLFSQAPTNFGSIICNILFNQIQHFNNESKLVGPHIGYLVIFSM